MPSVELTFKDFNILYPSLIPQTVSFGNDTRDFVLVTVSDQTGGVIESTEISVEELKVGELFNFNPGRILRKLGYIAGSYKVKLNFLRRKAGSTVYGFFDSDQELWTGAVQQIKGKYYTGTDPQATEVKLLSRVKLAYDVTDIGPSKKEVRLQLKNIDVTEQTSYASNFQTFDSTAFDYIPASTDDFTSEGTVTVDSSDPYKIKAILTAEDTGFSPAMVGGKLTIDNAYVIAYQTVNASSTDNTNKTTTSTNTVTDTLDDEDNPNLDAGLKDETKKDTTGGSGKSTEQLDKDV
jgi:hypothetical protein